MCVKIPSKNIESESRSDAESPDSRYMNVITKQNYFRGQLTIVSSRLLEMLTDLTYYKPHTVSWFTGI
jgi:hypothetical protein